MGLRPGVRQLAGKGFRGAAGVIGYDVVRRNFYSPIPDLDSLPADVFDKPLRTPGVEIDTAAMVELVEAAAPEIAGFPADFNLANNMFGPVDAQLLYAIVRTKKPRRILELGSGQSTTISAAAVRANRAEGVATRFVSADPYVDVSRIEGVERRNWKASEVPADEFESLAAGDILFVDTTHTVKVGSDVNYLILDVLPRLAAGVRVHFHDIFLPFEYPRHMIERNRAYWGEQYLLQAFLAYNDAWSVTFAAYATCRAHPERVRAVVPSYTESCDPGSFWIEKL